MAIRASIAASLLPQPTVQHAAHRTHPPRLENAAAWVCGLPALTSSPAFARVSSSWRARQRSHSSPGGAPGLVRRSGKGSTGALRVRALDAAMPFDYEAMQKRRLAEQRALKIGILGFGNFGQFLAARFSRHGHQLLAWSRSDYSGQAEKMGVSFFTDLDDFCEQHPDVVVLCASILSSDSLVRSLPVQRLKRNTLVVDVLSVKVFPKMLLQQALPPEFDILCTHPMFGPESGKGSWEGLPFVFDRVRVRGGKRADIADRFLKMFQDEGCRMVEMTCEEHDRYAAGTQFVTHTVGRVLGKLQLESTPIDTKGYETLLKLVENTGGDSFDLYYGLFMYNTNATEELQRLEFAFDAVKKQLLDQLHEKLREQLFGSADAATTVSSLSSSSASSSPALTSPPSSPTVRAATASLVPPTPQSVNPTPSSPQLLYNNVTQPNSLRGAFVDQEENPRAGPGGVALGNDERYEIDYSSASSEDESEEERSW